MASKEGKYLTFALGNEAYGIGILKVKEIVGTMPIVPIPQTPEFIRGVVNLRHKVIPVVDLRQRFGLPPTDYTDRTCIIVVEAHRLDMPQCWVEKKCDKEKCPAYGSHDLRCWMIPRTLCRDEVQGVHHQKIEECRKCEIYAAAQKQKSLFIHGVLVDSVTEVVNIREQDIEDTPSFGTKIDTAYILGMAKVENRVKILLNIDQVLSADELAMLERVEAEEQQVVEQS